MLEDCSHVMIALYKYVLAHIHSFVLLSYSTVARRSGGNRDRKANDQDLTTEVNFAIIDAVNT